MQNRLVIIEIVLNTSFVMNNKQKLMIKKHTETSNENNLIGKEQKTNQYAATSKYFSFNKT